jgi:TatA/E family protein of Tat protein translocase
MMPLFLFGVSMGEVILIFLIALMLFGSKKIPELARSLGKGVNEFKKATDGIKREFQESAENIKEELKGMEPEIRQNSNEIRDLADNLYKEEYEAKSNSGDVHELKKPLQEIE